ncbi:MULTISPECIES: hypothetical protein [Pseudoalteromonas]|uniref:hypothetical protein n=1 Tax=Pseudoalteromonas TaxID=53246 RepID=UPI000C34A060|nr:MULTISPECIES: hypothetical protein [Pseudoalteromonas]PKG65440.1 hypothetical protein CXF75_07555 [Pseudoalteromonas arctica]PKG69566.1 hypothetical protein CXF64_15350 [Pseudoalteromonas sp. GutCa3]
MNESGRFNQFIDATGGKFVPAEFAEAKLDSVSRLLASSYNSRITLNNIDEFILSKIKSRFQQGKYSKISVLCGGGVDSNYLLLLIAKYFPLVELEAVCGLTKSNSEDLKSTKIICKKYNVKYVEVTISKSELEKSLSEFFTKKNRLPNDVAAPIINVLINKAKSDSDNVLVIDGQYADTTLFANPQNTFFRLSKWLGLFNFRSKNKLDTNAFLKFSYYLKLLFSRTENKIFELCRLEYSEKIMLYISEQLRNYDRELVMQAIFFKVLIEFREKDKYLLSEDVYSPFYSDDLFLASYDQNTSVFDLRDKKKYLRNFVRINCPEAVKHMKSRTFESE